MEYKSDSDLLKTLRASKLTVKEIRLLKFGAIAVSKHRIPEDSDSPYTDRFDLEHEFEPDDGKDACRSLASAVESHGNVFNLQLVDDTFPTSECLNLGYKLFKGSIYRADVHLPKNQQKYQDMSCEEHFSIYLSGTYFAAIAKVDTLSPYSNIAHEFREIFREQVNRKTKFHAPIIGPSPVHPDFLIMGVEPAQGAVPDRFPQIHSFDGNVCVVVEAANVDDAVEAVFWDCLFSLPEYYDLAISRVGLIYIDSEVQSRMTTLVSAYAEADQLAGWKLKRIQRKLGVMRDQLASIYQLRVQHSRAVLSYRQQRQHFLERTLSSDTVAPLSREFRKDTVLDVDLPESLLPSLQFFQTQADAKRNIYSLIFSAIVGALVGGTLTFLATVFTLIHNRPH